MRQTLLHFDRELSGADRRQLCSALESRGGDCNARARSNKPHLVFVAYDENRLAPRDLVRIAGDIGHRARVVDI